MKGDIHSFHMRHKDFIYYKRLQSYEVHKPLDNISLVQHAIEVTEAEDVYSGFNEGNLSAHSASFNDAVPDTAKEWQEFPLI